MRKSTPEDFWNRVSKGEPNECWNWTGGSTVKYQGGTYAPGRLAFILSGGELPTGYVVRHKCDNDRCCNPAHLENGTHADNHRDMQERGRTNYRAASGENHYRFTLTLDMVLDIQKKEMSSRQYAAKHGISQWLAHQVLRGTSRTANELVAKHATR